MRSKMPAELQRLLCTLPLNTMGQFERRDSEQLGSAYRAGRLKEEDKITYDHYVGLGLLDPRASQTPDPDAPLSPSRPSQVLSDSDKHNYTSPSQRSHTGLPASPSKTLGSSPPQHQPDSSSNCSPSQYQPEYNFSPQPEHPGHASSPPLETCERSKAPQHSLKPPSPEQHETSRHTAESPSRTQVTLQIDNSSSDVVRAVHGFKECFLQVVEKDRAQREEEANRVVTCLQQQTEAINRLTDLLETQNGQ
ncbi:hypothetical protein K435DRAFT_964892 [Dendrothele bispora CBS 962.96]|uniref:Uncharacterized protein n=1 Tax=Dendrothele bispora (strain CBS 962.96) TaxID=1314807 RepID=A0A4S8M882_DENBC|nr:hypothetical protein K435DRAFT_964892 [Dendrothele bispora CBS 962.96]